MTLAVEGPFDHLRGSGTRAHGRRAWRLGSFSAGYGSQVTRRSTPNRCRCCGARTTAARHGRASRSARRLTDAAGNSDVDLAVAPDGTLYFLTMGFDRGTREGIGSTSSGTTAPACVLHVEPRRRPHLDRARAASTRKADRATSLSGPRARSRLGSRRSAPRATSSTKGSTSSP